MTSAPISADNLCRSLKYGRHMYFESTRRAAVALCGRNEEKHCGTFFFLRCGALGGVARGFAQDACGDGCGEDAAPHAVRDAREEAMPASERACEE
eukprot:CAMPEP_0185842008 /NCGR_PEP_ID=MMETSP1353-20130828/18190_1 /TAXON_ID=1077150 /ORGANISM="Erythrolobus australicus, Strain CCMP3124" /LENGTH=95 /DNA_ID=CAMNT_0028541503 /DNA_START=336 /DNA_END=623 /DNA_ORIENTATION=+